MKRVLVATVAAVALSASSAFAADMAPAPYYKAPPPPPTYSWTGCYVDGGFGYGLWNQNQNQTDTTGAPVTFTTTDGGRGWLGRFGGGCDYQLSGGLSNWVIGAFGDYDFMSVSGTLSPVMVASTGGATAPIPAGGSEKETGAGYAGARIGYLVMPTLLAYTDGGWTGTHFDSVTLSSDVVGAAVAASGRVVGAQNYNGWFIGGGVEYALTMPWLPIHGLFWRTEYRYSSYDSRTLTISNATSGAIAGYINSDKDVQTITSSLVWRFNWWR